MIPPGTSFSKAAGRGARPAVAALACLILTAASFAETRWQHEAGDTPADNPLKGLVPYAGADGERFPHSMQFFYLPLSAVVKGEDAYDWSELDRRLDAIAAGGRQAVFRVYLEYPGQADAIPTYLVKVGLKVHRYLNTNTAPAQEVATPDYEDPRLRKALAGFIAALGKRYDGDPRTGFITAGLLGTWGEWHTHPRDELFASKTVQREVMDAYEKAFSITPVLLRYPAGGGHPAHEPNATRSFGSHDDSFAWSTLDTGEKKEAWFFLPALRQAGPAATERWKTHPIGGEIRPEAWGKVFDESVEPPIQDFRRCVEETHVSWLLDSGMFTEKPSPERHANATAAVRRMGYDFRVTEVVLDEDIIRVTLLNQGVAPFYQPWKARFVELDAAGQPVGAETGSEHSLQGILPGESVTWEQRLASPAGPGARVLMQVPNPLKTGKPVRFANRLQDADRVGWLTLTPAR
jgi:hypothetical protein